MKVNRMGHFPKRYVGFRGEGDECVAKSDGGGLSRGAAKGRPQINDRRRDHPAFAGLAARVLSLRSSPPPGGAEVRSQGIPKCNLGTRAKCFRENPTKS